MFCSAPASAQASRTWVSGTGSDGNPCSRAQPCQTFAAALTATAAGGEISVLDPGGFGSVTITKSVSIYNDGVGTAGIVTAGTNAIVINAGANDVINLRGLTLNGLGAGTGVSVLAAGQVRIQKSSIQQFTSGVSVATSANVKVKIEDTTITNNVTGVNIQSTAGIANVGIERSQVDNNSGIGVLASSASGGSVLLAMADSSASLNGTHGVVSRSSASVVAGVTLRRNNILGNGQFGMQADGAAGAWAYIVVGDSLFTNNFSGAAQTTGNGSVYSFGTNQFIGLVGATLQPIGQR